MADDDKMRELPVLPWMPSRIPKRKALVTFVDDGEVCPAAVEAAMKDHPARWYPEQGGHRVLILHEGGAYDNVTFQLEPDGWDHEDCDVCGKRIAPMTLCYVTSRGPYVALCATCYRRHVLSKMSYWLLKIFGIKAK
jgi:hypothetical protein